MAGQYSAWVDDALHQALVSKITLMATGEFVTQQNAKALTFCHRFQDTFMHAVENLVSTSCYPL